jgi:hypothetical protein
MGQELHQYSLVVAIIELINRPVYEKEQYLNLIFAINADTKGNTNVG